MVCDGIHFHQQYLKRNMRLERVWSVGLLQLASWHIWKWESEEEQGLRRNRDGFRAEIFLRGKIRKTLWWVGVKEEESTMTSRFLLWVTIWSPSETNHREMSRFQGKDGSELGGGRCTWGPACGDLESCPRGLTVVNRPSWVSQARPLALPLLPAAPLAHWPAPVCLWLPNVLCCCQHGWFFGAAQVWFLTLHTLDWLVYYLPIAA